MKRCLALLLAATVLFSSSLSAQETDPKPGLQITPNLIHWIPEQPPLSLEAMTPGATVLVHLQVANNNRGEITLTRQQFQLALNGKPIQTGGNGAPAALPARDHSSPAPPGLVWDESPLAPGEQRSGWLVFTPIPRQSYESETPNEQPANRDRWFPETFQAELTLQAEGDTRKWDLIQLSRQKQFLKTRPSQLIPGVLVVTLKNGLNVFNLDLVRQELQRIKAFEQGCVLEFQPGFVTEEPVMEQLGQMLHVYPSNDGPMPHFAALNAPPGFGGPQGHFMIPQRVESELAGVIYVLAGRKDGLTELMKLAANRDPDIRAMAIQVLNRDQISQPAGQQLVATALDDLELQVRVAALTRVRNLKGENVEEARSALLEKVVTVARTAKEQEQRAAVVTLCQSLADPAAAEVAIPALAELIKNPELPLNLRQTILFACTAQAGFEPLANATKWQPQVSRMVAAHLTHPEVDIQAAAVDGARQCPLEVVEEPLLTILKNPETDLDVRLVACASLAALKSQAAIPVLKDLMTQEEEPELSAVAKEGLMTLGVLDPKEFVLQRLKTSAGGEGDVVYAKEHQLKEAVPSLIDHLKYNSRNVYLRIEIIETLGELGEKAAAPALVDVALTDTRNTVRGAALTALIKLGDPAAIPELEKLQKFSTSEAEIEGIQYCIDQIKAKAEK